MSLSMTDAFASEFLKFRQQRSRVEIPENSWGTALYKDFSP
jgi:hypothetical protein